MLAEGNLFADIPKIYESGDGGATFAVNDATGASACASSLGRDCVANSYSSSGAFDFSDSSVLSQFSGADAIATADDVSVCSALVSSAGYGTI